MAFLRNIALAAALSGAIGASATEVVGHRGASADAPENTVSSFKLGYAQGADACELDIHLSQDGRLVVIHDGNTKRVAGVDRPVAKQTLDALRKLNAAAFEPWLGKGLNEKFPTLDEALATVPAGKRMLIEIKVNADALPPLEATLKRCGLSPSQTAIITFSFDVAAAAKKKFPDRDVYWLVGHSKDEKTQQYPALADLIAKAKQAGLDGLDLDYHFPLDKAAIDQIKSAGLKCHVWTVDDPAVAQRLAAAGVDGVTTNHPGMMKKLLRN